VTCALGEALRVEVKTSDGTKCARCWHYTDDVGSDATHTALCARCVSNLTGSGETRLYV
jgi:isoleucyl-tRNA synthetase